jgi:hypothetical protein
LDEKSFAVNSIKVFKDISKGLSWGWFKVVLFLIGGSFNGTIVSFSFSFFLLDLLFFTEAMVSLSLST